jgi:hypothetical protein
MKKLTEALAIIILLFLSTVNVHAYTINDTYWGGTPNHAGWDKDIIGEYSLFGIDSMDVTRSGNNMTVVIHTPFASAYLANPNRTYGFALGDLFISNNGWKPYGVGPSYIEDTDIFGETWEFGVNASGVYSLVGATINYTNLNGYNPSSWVYRAGQEWTFVPTGLSLGSATMAINNFENTITYNFNITGLSLTGTEVLGFHWTMQCGNDVIEGAAPVPEPATMLLLGTGLVGLVGFGRKKFLKRI